MTTSGAFMAAAQANLQHVMAVILLHQVTAAGQDYGVLDANADADPSEHAQAPPHINILSKSNIARAMSWRSLSRDFVDFAEDLVAVRFVKLLVFMSVLVFFFLLSRVVPVFVSVITVRFGASENQRTIAAWIGYIVTVATGFWLAFAAVGVNLTGILLAFGFVGIALAPAIADTIRNIVAGIQVQVADKAEVGYVIQIGNDMGEVVSLTLADVILRSLDGLDTIAYVPNGQFGQLTMRLLARSVHEWHVKKQQMQQQQTTSTNERLSAFIVDQNGMKSKET